MVKILLMAQATLVPIMGKLEIKVHLLAKE